MAETRRASYIAIFASALMCLAVASASARQQTSSSQTTAPKSTQKSTSHTKTSSTTAKTTSTTRHRTTTTSTHKSGAKSASTGVSRTSTASRRSNLHTRKSSTRVRGQQKIDSSRATSIQQALIHEHYLSGEPSGAWDAESEAAMRRYQGDHGWQTKEVPDSRALIKLGLGPSNDHLLNPESAMTSTPIAPQSDPPAPTSHTPGSTQPTPNAGDPQLSAKPSTAPQTTPATQTVPAVPPKDADDTPNPQ